MEELRFKLEPETPFSIILCIVGLVFGGFAVMTTYGFLHGDVSASINSRQLSDAGALRLFKLTAIACFMISTSAFATAICALRKSRYISFRKHDLLLSTSIFSKKAVSVPYTQIKDILEQTFDDDMHSRHMRFTTPFGHKRVYEREFGSWRAYYEFTGEFRRRCHNA